MDIGDRPIGRTGVFGASDLGSSPSPRAITHELFPAPCRYCSGPSWTTDELGAVHSCCRLMWDGHNCIGCTASEQLNREQKRRRRLPNQLRVDSLISSKPGSPELDREEN